MSKSPVRIISIFRNNRQRVFLCLALLSAATAVGLSIRSRIVGAASISPGVTAGSAKEQAASSRAVADGPLAPLFANPTSNIFINEIHYDNTGADANEGVEIAGPAGTDLSGWTLVPYNGSGGASYAPTTNLTGIIANQQNGFGTINFLIAGLQNGAPDGIALVNGTTLVQFLCYEGSFTATNGPANGVACTNIGVSQPGTEAADLSLQLQGTGNAYGNFTWSASSIGQTRGAVNTGQTFTALTPTNPSGTGAANPNPVAAGGTTLLTVTVTPGANPTSTGIAVTGDLTQIGGSATQQFFDDGVSGGDATAGDNIFSFNATVGGATAPNTYNLPISIADAQLRAGVANISLTVISATSPTLNIDNVAQFEGNSGLTTFTFTVSLTSPAGPGGVTFDIQTFDGTAQDDIPATEDNDYVQKIETGRTIAAGNSSTTFTVDVNGDSTGEPNETFFVNVTNITGALAGDLQGQGTINNDDLLGAGAASPFAVQPGGSTLLTVAVTPASNPTSTNIQVTCNLTNIGGSATQQFFDDGTNGDLASGNNTFSFQTTVSIGTTLGGKVLPCTLSDAQGRVGSASITLTVFTRIHTIQGSGNATPLSGTVSTTGIVTLLRTGSNGGGGAASGFFLQTPDAEADADPNTSEGIFVFTTSVPTYTSPATPVAVGDEVIVTGTVVEFNGLTEITAPTNITVIDTGNPLPSAVTLNATILDPTALPTQPQLEKYEAMRMGAGSLISVVPSDGFFDVETVLSSVPRPMREPGIEISLPAVPPDPTSGLPDPNVPRWDENPERLKLDTNGRALSPNVSYTSNVTYTVPAGPLDFAFGEYRLIPEAPLNASANMSAVPLPTPLATEFTVAAFNIENFANGATQRTKASLAIRNVMRYPDIIGLEEIASLAALQALRDQINNDAVAASVTNPMYEAYLIPAPTGGTIHVGFLVKTTRVQVIGVTQERAGDTYIDPANGLPDETHDRPPLVLRATVDPSGPNPIPVIVVVNHPRSFIDIDQDPGAGPSVRAKRKAQGESIADLMDELQDNNPGNSIMTVGDFNAYEFNDGFTDPIATIKGIPTPDDQIVVDASPDLVDPDFFNLMELVPASERYTFIFEGTPQVLDHILVNRNAHARFTRIAVAHMDADFPESFVADITRPERASDHDAPVAYFDLTLAPSADDGVVSGRITDESGAPVAGAVVNLNGAQNRKTITDAKGNYYFDKVATTGFYTVVPSRANYSFSPASRSFSQLGNQTEAAFTASSNEDLVNPLDTPEYFVRQQYVDVLGREPDEGGFNYWSDEILNCGSDVACANARRRDVAAAFFVEKEFQDTGSYIYDMYKASLGRKPVFAEYASDRRQIIGGPNLETQKAAFADSFVLRPAFIQRYQSNSTAESFVDALLTTVSQSSGVNLASQRDSLISRYQSGASVNQSRSLVMLDLADNPVLRQVEYNAAFVLTEYFSYLRRDPEPSGYDFWLNVLNNGAPGDYRGMVCSFITSTEYQKRFSSVVTHSNAECGN